MARNFLIKYPVPWTAGTTGLTSSTKHPALILLLHWSGKAWTMAKTPPSAMPNDQLLTVTATSPDEAWAAGYSTCMQNTAR